MFANNMDKNILSKKISFISWQIANISSTSRRTILLLGKNLPRKANLKIPISSLADSQL